MDHYIESKKISLPLELFSKDEPTISRSHSIASELHQVEIDCSNYDGVDLINESMIQEDVKQDVEEVFSSDQLHIISTFRELLESSTGQILSAFEKKLSYDATKQKQIDSLHAELQKYRSDLIARTNRPLVNGLIRLHDSTGKLSENLRMKIDKEFDSEIFFNILESLREDIEILLDQNGIVFFVEQDEKFNPKRQHAIRQVKTVDNKLVGTIAERLRFGFEQGNDLIQKERVSIYVIDKAICQQDSQNKENINNCPIEHFDMERENGG